MLWTSFFGMEFYILKSNKTESEEFSGIHSAWGYFFVAFENGIGNIINPTISDWEEPKEKFTSAWIIIYLVYFVWFMN